MDVRASMARDVQCKHVSNLHVILHNRHQQLGSHRIMLSVGAEKALPTLGHADCTMHPVVLDDPDSLPSRTVFLQGRPLNHLAMAEHFTPLIK
jgi:hypothetical protein